MENNRKICSVIGGALCRIDKRLVKGFVIAADSGLDRCKNSGIVPDLVVGDFDSAKADVPKGVELVRLPTEKNFTDTFVAAHIAAERGYNELRFFCVLGGRISHSLANLQMLRALKQRGIDTTFFGEKSAMFLLEDEYAEIPAFHGYLSLFSLDEKAVVSEKGVKYPLDRHTLTNNFPLGVSNEVTDEIAEITVHSGLCAVVLEEEK